MTSTSALPTIVDRHLFFAFFAGDRPRSTDPADLDGAVGSQQFEVADTKPLNGTDPINFGAAVVYEISGPTDNFRDDFVQRSPVIPTTGIFVRPVSDPQINSAAGELTSLDDRHLWLVFSRRPADGTEFDRWYDTEHIPDFLAAPGVIRAQRFITDNVAPLPNTVAPDLGHLALYEIHGDPTAARNYVKDKLISGAMVLPDYMRQRFPAMFLRPVGQFQRS